MTILYVDDDADDRDIFCEAVTVVDDSLTCKTTGSGQEALEIITKDQIDIVLVDYRMPPGDAKLFLENLKAISGSVVAMPKIYIYSTYMNEYEVATCKALGATDCITKPGEFENICSLVRELVRQV
jgi:CheY-like chemotaxis protein